MPEYKYTNEDHQNDRVGSSPSMRNRGSDYSAEKTGKNLSDEGEMIVVSAESGYSHPEIPDKEKPAQFTNQGQFHIESTEELDLDSWEIDRQVREIYNTIEYDQSPEQFWENHSSEQGLRKVLSIDHEINDLLNQTNSELVERQASNIEHRIKSLLQYYFEEEFGEEWGDIPMSEILEFLDSHQGNDPKHSALQLLLQIARPSPSEAMQVVDFGPTDFVPMSPENRDHPE